nr:DUF2332 domain-containing protein [Kineosporia babensis]
MPEAYLRAAEVAQAENAPLYEQVARALGESPEAMQVLEPAAQRGPSAVLAALHDRALAGRAPELARAYAEGDAPAAGRAAVQTLLGSIEEVIATAGRRPVLTKENGRCAVLYPAVAEAALRVGAGAIALIDVGRAAGLNLNLDRVGLSYSSGRRLGDPSSPVQMSAQVVGERPIPSQPLPEVVSRTVVAPDPLDLTDADQARWLRAGVWPDHQEQMAVLNAELDLAVRSPVRRLAGVINERLPEALAEVPADVLPVVTTTWALSHLSLEARLRFLHCLDEAATHRPVAWVSVEGVGVAPAVPTMGDRRASGHSTIGLSVFEHASTVALAVGRSWSQGRTLAWLV